MEQTFRADEGVLLVEGRVVRRVIRAHRNIKGLGLSVPHVRCYAIPRDALLRLAAPEDLDPAIRNVLTRATDLQSVTLVARLSQAETSRLPPSEVTNRLWRAAFHARVHVEIEQRMDSGHLPEATLRERIDRIGQAEFDEIREMLRQDDLLLPPGGDREAYAEFVALFLELRHFAPRLLPTTFPSLDTDRIEMEIARDLDSAALLSRACPEGIDPAKTIALLSGPTSSSTGISSGPMPEAARFVAPEGASAERMLERAISARSAGNRVRAALLAASVGHGQDAHRVKRARASEREDLEALNERLKNALRPPAGAPAKADLEWTSLLLILTDEAAARSGLRYSIEARLLFDLQNAALANERKNSAVDLVTWAISLGKRPVVRPLPVTRTLRIARLLHAASRKVKLVRVAPADRKLLTKLLDRAVERAHENVRTDLRPQILTVLDQVGLRPASTPERVARDKLVEELLDHAVERGFFNMGHLRDALSRNHLKLEDLANGAELWTGDALLRADRALSISLDGVYRPGEIYLRGLQKVSSVLFGTRAGRAVVLYAILPIGGAFIALEGISHILAPVFKPFGIHPKLFVGGLDKAKSPLPEELHGFTTLSFWVTVLFVFGLLHSEAFRSVVMRALRLLGSALGTLFVRVPRAVLSLPSVERVLEGRPARVLARHALIPAFVALVAYLAFSFGLPTAHWGIHLAVTLGVFAIVSFTLGTRLGDRTEDMFVEHVAPTWKMLSHKILPGVFRAIVDFFRWLMDGMERIFYRVDELLRFREGENQISLGFKALVGLVWFFVAYAVRVYVALLIEPYVNPVKQVPMTAAAHKMMLPFAPQIITLFDRAFAGLPFIGSPLAGITAFFFPTVFGFFGWELKENYKLYRASRRKELGEAVIGAHGETMNGFLVAGFHSGTLPKLFARLRHAARREEELEAATQDARHARRAKGEGARGRFREGTQEVETSIRHFIEREMLSLLAADPRWPHGPLTVSRVACSSNRVRITILCAGVAVPAAPAADAAGRRSSLPPHGALELTFEEQSGYVVAGVARVGFADALRGNARVLFENALAGLYKLAAADLVREQLEMAMGGDLPYDIADDGLLVWPGPGYTVEALYPLRTDAPVIEPTLRGGVPAKPLPPLDARAISFRHQPVAWSAWVYAWSPETGKDPPRLMTGPSLIPVA